MMDIREIKSKLSKAHDTVSALCHGGKKWVMHIPAQVNEDPDLIISAGLRAGDEAVRVIECLRCELAEAKLEAKKQQARIAVLEGSISEALLLVDHLNKAAVCGAGYRSK
jgi:hypothetical protein